MARTILHADLDAFYASVEQRDAPSLRGKPVVVGGAPEQRGVVAAASYEARRFGVRSAMSMRAALRLCPEAHRVAPRFDAYAAVSADVMAIFHTLTDLVEPLSLDEAYLDVSQCVAAGQQPAELASQLKRDVRERVCLTISVGAATTKSAAKIASDLRKPDGLVCVEPGLEAAFMGPLPVGKLWGVGPKGEARLHRLGVQTIGQLALMDPRILAQLFGKWGEALADLARGIDDRPVEEHREVKSVSRETTFSADIADGAPLRAELARLCAGVAERLGRRALRGKTVTVKVRRDDFTTRTRQATLPASVLEEAAIYGVAARLLDAELEPGERLRLLGVAVSGFTESAQLPLFPLG